MPVPPLSIYEISSCGYTARFVSDLVGNPEDRLCRVVAQLWCYYHVYLQDFTDENIWREKDLLRHSIVVLPVPSI